MHTHMHAHTPKSRVGRTFDPSACNAGAQSLTHAQPAQAKRAALDVAKDNSSCAP